MKLKELNTVYFLGIGGIGMSALARYFKQEGITVYGYDRTSTPLTAKLESEGIEIHYEENISLIPQQIELVIYTPAIPQSNKELIYLKENNIPLFKRAEVLGIISRDKYNIAVAGTHGKTSVSSIIAHIFKTAGIPITAFIGGIMKNYNSNFINDKGSEIVIVEADEFDKSFLHLNPDMALITSTDADHLDIYKNKDNLINTFKEFAKNVKEDGTLIIKKGTGLQPSHFNNCLSYTLSGEATFSASNIQHMDLESNFTLVSENEIIENITIQIPGKHNIENSVAASSVAITYGISKQKIKEALISYTGVKRRFDIRYNHYGKIYIDDYAHHPEEIRAFLNSVRQLFPGKELTGIFQPHLYSRTRDFLDDFASSLELLDQLYLLEIYPAREEAIPGITSSALFNLIKLKNKELLSKEEVIDKIRTNRPEVLLSMGAGSIDQMVEPLEKIDSDEKDS